MKLLAKSKLRNKEQDLWIPVFKCTSNPKTFRNNVWHCNELCACAEAEPVDDHYEDYDDYGYDDYDYDYYQSDYYGETFVMDGDDIVGDR